MWFSYLKILLVFICVQVGGLTKEKEDLQNQLAELQKQLDEVSSDFFLLVKMKQDIPN